MTSGRTVDTFRKFADIIREDVIPLLEEYCYEDFSILANLLGTSLVDETSMRIRDELFEPVSKEKLVSALLAPCPEIAASFRATDFETDEPETDNDEIDESQNGMDN
jgi:5-methylcytosine-specific restriction protein B